MDERLVAHPGLFVGGNAWRGVGFNDCIAAAGPLAERMGASLAW
jgi:oxygen-dependent protoporphyrinogen oxidase